MTYSNTSIAALAAAAFLGLVGCGDRGADNTGQAGDTGVSDTAPATGETGAGTTGGTTGDYATDTPSSDMSQSDGTAGSAMDPNTGSATDMQEGATSDQAGDTSTTPQQ
jgi:hypothetical protein